MEALFLILFFALFAGAVVVDAVAPALKEALGPALKNALGPAAPAMPARPAGTAIDHHVTDRLDALESELGRVRDERDFYRSLSGGALESEDEAAVAEPGESGNVGKVGVGAVVGLVSTALEFL